MTGFDRRVLWILSALAALLIIIVLVGSRTGGADPRLNGALPEEPVETGAYGPLVLTFSEPVQASSLEATFTLSPPVAGRFSWMGEDTQSVAFWPAHPLTPGQRYTLRVGDDLKSKRGMELRQEKNWQVTVRQPALLYLAPSREPELWQVGAEGQNPRRLTETGGKVYDYAASLDGSRILFSARNEQGGLDLWEIERGAGQPVLLLPCGADWCFEPAVSPNLQTIAYSRRTFSGLSGSAPGAPRLWIYERAGHTTAALLGDPALGGSGASWSPDGRYLAFTDPLSQSVRVVDFLEKTDFAVPGGEDSRVAWSPAGSSFFMTKPESSEAFPYVLIYEVDVATRQAQLWEGEQGLSQVDYSLPIPSPDGTWIAVSRRLVGGGPGKQLWLVPADGGESKPITLNPLANFAGYQWDPTSKRLVFQRLFFSGSASLPSILLWSLEDSRQMLIAEDAFQPHWLP